MKKPRTLEEKRIDAEAWTGKYLADANEASEKGYRELAENLHAKSQFWLDRANSLEDRRLRKLIKAVGR